VKTILELLNNPKKKNHSDMLPILNCYYSTNFREGIFLSFHYVMEIPVGVHLFLIFTRHYMILLSLCHTHTHTHTHTHRGMLKISHKLMGFLQTWRHYSVCLSRSYVIFMNPTCSPLIHCLCFFPPLRLNMRELENKCASSQAFYIVMMQLCFFIKELLYVER
jgi:hypothetical protein